MTGNETLKQNKKRRKIRTATKKSDRRKSTKENVYYETKKFKRR